jgi:hypothetical protein
LLWSRFGWLLGPDGPVDGRCGLGAARALEGDALLRKTFARSSMPFALRWRPEALSPSRNRRQVFNERDRQREYFVHRSAAPSLKSRKSLQRELAGRRGETVVKQKRYCGITRAEVERDVGPGSSVAPKHNTTTALKLRKLFCMSVVSLLAPRLHVGLPAPVDITVKLIWS